MEAECPGPSQPKKQRRDCKFKLEWKSFGVSTSKKGTSFAHCDICRVDFSIAHAGVNDVKKHVTVSTIKHQENVKSASGHH